MTPLSTMSFFKNLLRSWGACFQSEDDSNQPESLQINNLVYKSPESMTKAMSEQQPPVDVCDAEANFGISFFSEYIAISYSEQDYPIVHFKVLYQRPVEFGTVSCPIVIDASRFSEEKRAHLRNLLEFARSKIPKRVIDDLHMSRGVEEILAVYPKEADFL